MWPSSSAGTLESHLFSIIVRMNQKLCLDGAPAKIQILPLPLVYLSLGDFNEELNFCFGYFGYLTLINVKKSVNFIYLVQKFSGKFARNYINYLKIIDLFLL
jgi:hypothetical protein